MKNDHVPLKEDLRKMKPLQFRLEKWHPWKPKTDQRYQLKITQSMKAGHIRGGHAFH